MSFFPLVAALVVWNEEVFWKQLRDESWLSLGFVSCFGDVQGSDLDWVNGDGDRMLLGIDEVTSEMLDILDAHDRMCRVESLARNSALLHEGQQLPGAADCHEPGVVVVVACEVLVGWEADEDDGFRIESFRLVDGCVANGVRGVLLLDAFPEVVAGEDATVAERAARDVGLGVEDENVRRIAEAGFFPAGEDGFDERAGVGSGGKRMDFRVRAFGKVVALAECLDHPRCGGVGVIAEKLPERTGVTDGRLKPDVRRLRPGGGQNCGIKTLGGAEGRSLGGIIKDTRRSVPAFFEKDLVDVPPSAGFTGQGVDFRVPAGVVILTLVHDKAIKARPGFSVGRVA